MSKVKSKSCKNISSHCNPKIKDVKKVNTKDLKDVKKSNIKTCIDKKKEQQHLHEIEKNRHMKVNVSKKSTNCMHKCILKTEKKRSFLDKFVNWFRGY